MFVNGMYKKILTNGIYKKILTNGIYKRILSALVIVAVMLSFAGCGSRSENSYTVYYLNIDKTAIVTVDVELNSNKLDDIIDELIGLLSMDTNSVEYFKTIPTDVAVRECKVSNGNLIIDFSPQYNNLKGEAEILTRSAIAKTMLQVEGVNLVSFYVSGKPMTDEAGNVLTPLSNDSFLDDYGNASSFKVKKEVSLYYATSTGEDLICEKKVIDVDERVQLADVVLEYLRKKPETENAQVAIPEDTMIVNTSVSDGVCYVTLDSTLLTEKPDISSKAIIYSIVNSLCDSADVKSVVIKTTNTNDATQQDYLDLTGTYVSDKSMVVATNVISEM